MAMFKAVALAARNLRRAPAFTALVVLTLALGIGATTAMFSVVDAVLINPLPFPNSERFGQIWTVPEKGSRYPSGSTALLNALHRQTDLFTAVGAYQFGSANLTGNGEPEILGAPQLSPSLLTILGVRPILGRWFTDDEAATGTVVLIGERFWRSHFGGDSAIRDHLRASALIRRTDAITVDDLAFVRPSLQLRRYLYMLFVAVGLVLLVACVNVMNLLLVRGSARRAELALMSSLGASRGRLVRDVFLETVALAAGGCVAGIALARGLLTLIVAVAPRQMLFLGKASSQLDGRALTFAMTLAIATCAVFGLLPAWRAGRIDAIDALKQRAQGLAGAADEWWQGGLVAAQLALVLVLLTGSGLLMRSFGKLVAVDPGFDVDYLAVVDLQLPRNRYGSPGAGPRIHARART